MQSDAVYLQKSLLIATCFLAAITWPLKYRQEHNEIVFYWHYSPIMWKCFTEWTHKMSVKQRFHAYCDRNLHGGRCETVRHACVCKFNWTELNLVNFIQNSMEYLNLTEIKTTEKQIATMQWRTHGKRASNVESSCKLGKGPKSWRTGVWMGRTYGGWDPPRIFFTI